MTKHLELSKLSTNNLQELQDFIAIAKADADKLKGLKIANDNDIAKSLLKLSLASLSASIKVSKCSINNFMALSLISNFASVTNQRKKIGYERIFYRNNLRRRKLTLNE
jgi:hypothetical protein